MRRIRLLVFALAIPAVGPCTMVPVLGADNGRVEIVGNDGIPLEWLDEKITIEEAERRHPGMPDDDRVQRFPEIRKPFGFLSPKWDALKAQMQPDDELWTFSSPPKSWEDLAGRSGIALVRDKTVIASIVTMMN